MFLSLPLTGALLLSALSVSAACALEDVRVCFRRGPGRHRRAGSGRHAQRGGAR